MDNCISKAFLLALETLRRVSKNNMTLAVLFWCEILESIWLKKNSSKVETIQIKRIKEKNFSVTLHLQCKDLFEGWILKVLGFFEICRTLEKDMQNFSWYKSTRYYKTRQSDIQTNKNIDKQKVWYWRRLGWYTYT